VEFELCGFLNASVYRLGFGDLLIPTIMKLHIPPLACTIIRWRGAASKTYVSPKCIPVSIQCSLCAGCSAFHIGVTCMIMGSTQSSLYNSNSRSYLFNMPPLGP